MSPAQRMITLRLSPDQHRQLAKEAAASNQSLNTYLLNRLGMETTTPSGHWPRGRRSPAATEKPDKPVRPEPEPSAPTMEEAFAGAKWKFWTCPECIRPIVKWNGLLATCQSCGRTNQPSEPISNEQ